MAMLGFGQKEKLSYWEGRKDARYLKEVLRIVDGVSEYARSILDVGSNGCAYLDWFPDIPRRVSLDLNTPYSAEGVESIQADFFTHEFPEPFDIVTCLQVLEHIPDAERFAQKLLSSTRQHLVVSVPYKWREGKCRWHVHDPVDKRKMFNWFGREPNYSRIVRNHGWRGTARLVCRYDVR